MERPILVNLVFLLAVSGLTSAETYTVPGDYPGIQVAIDNSNDGDMIIVSAGSYYENVDFHGKNVALTSVNPDDPEIVAATIIDAKDVGRAVIFANGEGEGTLLTGFTITGGKAYGPDPSFHDGGGIYCVGSSPEIANCVIEGNSAANCGGGMYSADGGSPTVVNCTFSANEAYAGNGMCNYNSSPTVTNCTFTNNIGGDMGGGMWNRSSSPTLINCVFSDNSKWSGGGMYNSDDSDPTLINCIFRDNSVGDDGAGMRNTNNCNPILINCVFIGNSADDNGGAMSNRSCSPTLINCTLVGNSAAGRGGGLYNWDCSLTVSNCIIWSNSDSAGVGELSQVYTEHGTTAVDYSCIQGWTGDFGGAGNIAADPLFVESNGNGYHLPPISLCINAGDPNFVAGPDQTDIDGQVRVDAIRVDIGADEYVGPLGPVADAGPDQAFYSSSLPALVALDGSGSYDRDGGILTYHWSQIDGPAVDLDNPNAVQPTFEPLEFGTYVFELVVNDGLYDSYPNTVAIIIGNNSPKADAGPDQSMSTIPGQITLDGSRSYDVDKDSLTHHWVQIAGPAVDLTDENVVDPAFTPSEFGIYVFELVVNDGAKDSERDTVGIVVGDNHAPIADAGSGRYVAEQAVTLDGTGSFDPDGYGELTYQWTQISGPTVTMTDEDSSTPLISGLVQNHVIGECEFELVVSDGELSSRPDTVSVIIVPDFGENTLYQSNGLFDADKPTIVAFGGGNCTTGGSLGFGSPWNEKANWITVNSGGYGPPYTMYGDMLIVYLSEVAPDYEQPIQTMGYSTGNMPAIDVANYLNLTYADPRYAVNRVTLFDAACRDYSESVATFLASSVDGEQCWLDNYFATHGEYYQGALNIKFPPPAGHSTPVNWYSDSLLYDQWPNGDIYAGGVTAGGFVSVIGPARNLNFATDSANYYYFKWVNAVPEYLMFYNESSYPGALPQPVTLIGPDNGSVVDANGAVLTCEESENAVGYQLLFGPDPNHMVLLVSDTADPPDNVITEFPFEKTWWTVKVRDQFGSTIYADPICINAEKATHPPVVRNLTLGKEYFSIQQAIDDARNGDEIVAYPGTWEYMENITFKGENIVLRSPNPKDPAVVAATVINGPAQKPVVTFPNGENKGCVLAGFTITGGSGGVYCDSSNGAVSNCVIVNSAGTGVHCFGENPESDCPKISNCVIASNGGDGVYSHGNSPIITNCTIADNAGRGIYCYYCRKTTTVTNSIVWANSDDQIAVHYAPISVTYSDIADGWPGLGNIDANPLFAWHAYPRNPDDPVAVPTTGDYHLRSQQGRWDPEQNTWVADLDTSPCVDAGSPGFSLGGEPDAPDNLRINMGVFGGTSEASKTPAGWSLLADLTNDGRVNFIDLAAQAAILGEQDNALPGDLDRNAAVDMADVVLLVEDWLRTSTWCQ